MRARLEVLFWTLVAAASEEGSLQRSGRERGGVVRSGKERRNWAGL